MTHGCMDCYRAITPTVHGFCPWCGSKAIADATGTNFENLRAEILRQREINHLTTMLYLPDRRTV